MKIISKYVLREHVGPFTFALTALTSLMILNFISRQFGELVGKGLPASVIGEFFLLSIPFTIALTVPMSVLVAVLYAFSRLASENEVTALKASGVSPWRIVTPSLAWGVVMSLLLLIFNDQVLPRANYRLKTLQDDIAQTKPTFLLRAQVINAVQEGKLYLKAGSIDRGSGRMRDVVIYDLSDPTRRRTIYGDSGSIQMVSGTPDLAMELYSGQIQEVATEKPSQLDRLFYSQYHILVKDVGSELKRSQGDSAQRGDRELGICAMQKRLRVAKGQYDEARKDYAESLRLAALPASARQGARPTHRATTVPPEPHNIGWAYCRVLSRLIGVRAAQAADLRSAGLHPVVQDTIPKRGARDSSAAQDSVRRRAADSVRRAAGASVANPGAPAAGAAVPAGSTSTAAPPGTLPAGQPTVILGTSKPPAPGTPGATPVPVPSQTQGTGVTPAPAPPAFRDPFLARSAEDSTRAIAQKRAAEAGDRIENIARASENKLRFEMAQRTKNRYELEIHKKFALAAACIIFVMIGAPVALRFPRGGVGLVLLVSLIVFALYYVGLIGGEALANKGRLNPIWAMWGTNVILTAAGVFLLARMGREENSGRGGTWGDRIDRWRDALRWRRRHAAQLREEAV